MEIGKIVFFIWGFKWLNFSTMFDFLTLQKYLSGRSPKEFTNSRSSCNLINFRASFEPDMTKLWMSLCQNYVFKTNGCHISKTYRLIDNYLDWKWKKFVKNQRTELRVKLTTTSIILSNFWRINCSKSFKHKISDKLLFSRLMMRKRPQSIKFILQSSHNLLCILTYTFLNTHGNTIFWQTGSDDKIVLVLL